MSMTIGGTSGLVFPDASTQTTAASGFGFKNRIINGAMMIDQRNAGASVTVNALALFYGIDRFRAVGQNSSGVFTMQQVSDAPTGFGKSLKVTVTTADSSIASSDRYFVQQVIEGLNVADLGFGTTSASTVTISFWVKSSLTGTFGGCLQNDAPDRSYPFTYTINSANTWEQKTVTIAGDTTGTWATNNTGWGRVTWSMGNGSTNSSTAGSWQAGNFEGVTGQVQPISTLNATWQVTGVQLEKGSTATSFDYRPYGTELQLCYRYFAKFSAPCLRGIAVNSTTESGRRMGMVLPVTMRATPTVTHSGMQLYDGSVACNVTGTAAGFSTAQVIELDLNSDSSSMTLGRACVQYQSAGSLSASAEL